MTSPLFVTNLDFDVHSLDIAADELEIVVGPVRIYDRPAEIAIYGDATVGVNHLIVVEDNLGERPIRRFGTDDQCRLHRPDDVVADLDVVHMPARAVAKLRGDGVVVATEESALDQHARGIVGVEPVGVRLPREAGIVADGVGDQLKLVNRRSFDSTKCTPQVPESRKTTSSTMQLLARKERMSLLRLSDKFLADKRKARPWPSITPRPWMRTFRQSRK